ncbi:TetR/AcrR family transcriptional regulator [Frankia sp. AiPa1]|uniref:TetR/AcrR family transcriptional regulator n=1 Tax=Frankia sp. AiPa1 TaxID=573492 RepID=UPI00202B0D09|nr:TetR/AcrR family transcriptional regulator [Frankia sp. AiPa1]MCL9761157.1 TetR/AcrR family transcriptional regulator [Frankia sp. AiPa1]
MAPTTAEAAGETGETGESDAPAASRRVLRRDAEYNRARIVTAARELFVERGVDVGVEEIARRAGVGMGTLYRRFPTKDALVETILVDAAGHLRDLAIQIAEVEPARSALRTFVTRAMLGDPSHRLFLAPGMWQGAAGRVLVDEVLAPVATMLAAAQQTGVVRRDVVLTDLLVMMWSLWTVADLTERIAPGSWRRFLEVALAGLRPDERHDGLPAAPPEFVELAQIVLARRTPAGHENGPGIVGVDAASSAKGPMAAETTVAQTRHRPKEPERK